MRNESVVNLTSRSEGYLADLLLKTMGKVTSLSTILLLSESGGYTATDAAASPGDSLAFTTTKIDFADAGIDQIRLVVRGLADAVAVPSTSVVVQLYDLTNSVALATVTVTDDTQATFTGDWTGITPTGSDQEVELRVIGDGALDPELYAVHMQARTLQAKV